ncbi:MAG: PIN domain-containing protein [Thermoanaerobaculia bacterium]
MAVAYVDTSCFVAIAFGERGAVATERRMEQFDELVASNFLEAELRSAFRREKVEFDADTVAKISWLIADRPLTEEIARVLERGYVRGADCWHLATALYLSPDPTALTFLTLDETQRRVAKALGFSV